MRKSVQLSIRQAFVLSLVVHVAALAFLPYPHSGIAVRIHDQVNSEEGSERELAVKLFYIEAPLERQALESTRKEISEGPETLTTPSLTETRLPSRTARRKQRTIPPSAAVQAPCVAEIVPVLSLEPSAISFQPSPSVRSAPLLKPVDAALPAVNEETGLEPRKEEPIATNPRIGIAGPMRSTATRHLVSSAPASLRVNARKENKSRDPVLPGAVGPTTLAAPEGPAVSHREFSSSRVREAVSVSGARSAASPYGSNRPPTYPREARKNRWEGKVILAVTILPDGRVEEVSVRETSQYKALDEAAINALRRWRFHPAEVNGIAVESIVLVPVVFRLK